MTLERLISPLGDLVEDEMLVTARATHPDDAPPILWANAALLRNTGWTMAELRGRSIDVLFGPDTDAEATQRLGAALVAGRSARETVLSYRRDGSAYWIDALVQVVTEARTRESYQVSVRRDVSDLVKLRDLVDEARAEADAAQRRLWGAIEALPHAFVIYDAEDRLVMCNQRYSETYALSAPAIHPGARFEDVIRHGLEHGQYPEAEGREQEWLAERLSRHRSPPGQVTQVLAGDVHLQVCEVHTSWGDTVGFRIDLTELVRSKREVEIQSQTLAAAMEDAERRARTDMLTGLANRRGLDLYLAGERPARGAPDRGAPDREAPDREAPDRGAQGHELPDREASDREASDREASDREAPAELAVLHVDLDRFKQINDMFGHAAGDHVLRAVADILRRSVRPQDCVARLGGDEFAVVLRGPDCAAMARTVADRIISACAEPVLFEDKLCRFGASIGIAVAPDGSPKGLTEDADIALYDAKRGGRHRYALFTPALRRAAQERKVLADDLVKGLAADEIVVQYHPQIEAATGRLHGVEALARWAHPVRGLLMPATFLPIAEDLGVTAEIDARVLRKSLADAAALASEDCRIPKVSVNASCRRIASEEVRAELAALGRPTCRLAFELLETIDFDGQADGFFWTLDALREAGVEIELDDFGSGHASITTLLRLRPERIKIDRQLVAALAADLPEAELLISAICDMAHAMDIRLTAEGVETEAQARTLHRLGCDVLQGFLFTRPLPVGALRDWLRARGSAPGAAVPGLRRAVGHRGA